VLGADWHERLATSPFALIEALQVPARDFEVHESRPEQSRTLVEADWSLLATLPCLSRLALMDMSVNSTSGLAQLPALTDLNLSGFSNCGNGLAGLAGAPEVRRLCLAHSSGIGDLGPLAELPKLVWLSLYGTAMSDIASLGACSRLAELDLRRTHVDDILALEQLERLRVLHLDENSSVSNAELGRLQRANPRLQIAFGSEGKPFAKPESIDAWFWKAARLRLR
jgi:Leucine-rich repeat (LRR) protein